MKKALVITWEKYQDHELIYPYYSLMEHGFTVDIMANKVGKIWGSLGTHMPCTRETTEFLDEVNVVKSLEEYEVLLVPGGVKALEKVRQEKGVLEFIRRWNAMGKTIFCICNGAQLLISAKILEGRTMSGYYSIDVDIENVLSGKYSVHKINDTILHEINKLENEIITDSDKSDAINAEKKRIATVNKQKIAKHQDMLNTLNSGFMKMEQFQGESEEEYLKILNDIAAQPYNENLYFNATIDNIEKLKKSFKDITKDNTVIEGVVNGLSTEYK